MRLLILLLACSLCGCPDSRPPPRRNAPVDPGEAAPATPPAAPETLESLLTQFEAARDRFLAEPDHAQWEAAVSRLDALRKRAEARFEELGGYDAETLDAEGEAALEILEDYEPVERDELVRARPNQVKEPADAGSQGR